MLQTISITPKWQIHIPVEFRKILGLDTPGLAEIKIIKDSILLKPKPSSVMELAGKYRKFKPTKRINLDKIREEIDYSRL